MLISHENTSTTTTSTPTTIVYLKALVDPMIRQIKEIMEKRLYEQDPAPLDDINDDGAAPPLVRTHLNHMIMAIGSISKGFPDFDSAAPSTAAPPDWTFVLREALECVLQVLQELNSSVLIRDAVFSICGFILMCRLALPFRGLLDVWAR